VNTEKKPGRRQFIKNAGLTGVAISAVAFGAPTVWASGKTYSWKMITAWPPGDSILQEGAERFARLVNTMSEGLMTILLPAQDQQTAPMEIFDLVSKGEAQVGSAVAFYWADRVPAGQWFAAVPFGLNAQGMNAWLYTGGGLQLWEETYAPFGVVPRPIGNTGAQMGGWFKSQIRHASDFRGLKIRMPGLGGMVMARAGAQLVDLPGADLLTALQNGQLDGAEWIGPHHDLALGLHKAAPFYYYPGWHEPGSCIEALFHKPSYDALPSHLKTILDCAAAEVNTWCLSMFQSQNYEALKTLVTEHGVQLQRFPMSALSKFRQLSQDVMGEVAQTDAMAQKVHQAYLAFAEKTDNWDLVSERAYYDYVATAPQHLKRWMLPPDPY
jgi:TRAP-type mannitol/chloroaromatic compound transport system substrate-binding protein